MASVVHLQDCSSTVTTAAATQAGHCGEKRGVLPNGRTCRINPSNSPTGRWTIKSMEGSTLPAHLLCRYSCARVRPVLSRSFWPWLLDFKMWLALIREDKMLYLSL